MSDRSTRAGAGPPETEEIEITPEMIKAGTVAYLNFDLRGGEIEDRVTVVYEAMFFASKKK
jgi:hypothetical protein